MHHRFIAHRNDLDDFGMLLRQANSRLDFSPVSRLVFRFVVNVWSPCGGALNPGAQHHIHFKIRLLKSQFFNRVEQVFRMFELLRVVRPDQLDPHPLEDPHVLLDLVNRGYNLTVCSAEASVTEGQRRGIVEQLRGRHGAGF